MTHVQTFLLKFHTPAQKMTDNFSRLLFLPHLVYSLCLRKDFTFHVWIWC